MLSVRYNMYILLYMYRYIVVLMQVYYVFFIIESGCYRIYRGIQFGGTGRRRESVCLFFIFYAIIVIHNITIITYYYYRTHMYSSYFVQWFKVGNGHNNNNNTNTVRLSKVKYIYVYTTHTYCCNINTLYAYRYTKGIYY